MEELLNLYEDYEENLCIDNMFNKEVFMGHIMSSYESYSKNIYLDNLYNKEEWHSFYQYKPQDFMSFDNFN